MYYMMNAGALFLIVALWATGVSAGPDGRCLLLPPDAKVHWQHSVGPDFEVCHASMTGSKATVFGIYLGNFPSFDPKHAVRVSSGVVGGRDVSWYQGGPGGAGDPFSRQTIVSLDPKGHSLAHVWVFASNDAQLQERMELLRHIRLIDYTRPIE